MHTLAQFVRLLVARIAEARSARVQATMDRKVVDRILLALADV